MPLRAQTQTYRFSIGATISSTSYQKRQNVRSTFSLIFFVERIVTPHAANTLSTRRGCAIATPPTPSSVAGEVERLQERDRPSAVYSLQSLYGPYAP